MNKGKTDTPKQLHVLKVTNITHYFTIITFSQCEINSNRKCEINSSSFLVLLFSIYHTQLSGNELQNCSLCVILTVWTAYLNKDEKLNILIPQYPLIYTVMFSSKFEIRFRYNTHTRVYVVKYFLNSLRNL